MNDTRRECRRLLEGRTGDHDQLTHEHRSGGLTGPGTVRGPSRLAMSPWEIEAAFSTPTTRIAVNDRVCQALRSPARGDLGAGTATVGGANDRALSTSPRTWVPSVL